MKRRVVALATGGVALGTVLVGPHAFAQAAPRRIGLLTPFTEGSVAGLVQAVRDGLREYAPAANRDTVIDVRFADGRAQDLPRLATELATLKPGVIIALGPTATDAALAASADVPIVSLGDLVASGHAAQLGRPGGRVTGISFLPTPLNTKRLELLAGLLPRGSAVLNLVDLTPLPGAMQMVEDAGRALGLVTHAAYANTPPEIEQAFVTARALRVAGVNVLNSPFLHGQRALIMQLAASARLPAIYQWPETAREGGLMGYGPSASALFRQLAGYATRILAGAKPADLPIEQPTRFEFVVNLKTAKALGITIAPALLLRADEVIQ